ncbi:SH3 domain-containing protein [Mesorhizobium sp. Root102]|uniref:SH3 domain-containing protein n=1 Tax=Mesorhizobium sp. Root102 TaxID=1736422 RepID=UPI001FCCC638|nr:SH3 domain-containing protein [Mesorhizobium sp. Root102]
MIGQLFNGDRTEIFDRRGNWYQVEIGGRTGWQTHAGCVTIAATETPVHVAQKWIRFWDNDMHQAKA